ncbi:MAG TPA: FtsX-like permease family protein [Steroidobacteraceae bacterium]
MRLQDFRIGARILASDPIYSLVSILGLGVGLGVFLLLLAYARYCWSYNAYVPDADQVYIVKQRNNLELGTPWYDQAPLGLLAVARTIPGVKSATAYVNWLPLTVEVDGQLRKLGSLTVLPGFAEILGLEAIKGDLNEALSRPDAFAITEKAAIRLFGTSDVLGRTLELRLSAVDENRSIARIAAIVRDPPANTTIPFETLNGPHLGLVPPALRNQLLGTSSWMAHLLIRVQPGTSPTAVTNVLQQAFDHSPLTQKIPPEQRARLGDRPVREFELSGLRDAYFDREVRVDWLSLPVDRGDSTLVAGLVAVALLILVLAAMNYINLATIRVVRRQREIAMRKVLGVSNTRLAFLLVAESLLVSLLATATGLMLAQLALPVFSQLMNRDLESMLSLENVGIALGLGILVGLTTALYPAWIAFGVRPSLMLMGRPDSETPGSKRLRQVLSVIQVSVAMGLASYTLAISWQAGFAMDASPGFDPTSLLVFDLPKGVQTGDAKARGLMTALSQRPEVAGVMESTDAVGRSQESWSTEIKREGHEAVTIDVKTVSPNFFQQYGIRPAAGRLFDPAIDKEADQGPMVINEIAAHQLGFVSPEQALGQALLFRSNANGAPVLITKRIVGIAPEIRFHSLREGPGAEVYELSNGQGVTLSIRASGPIAAAERASQEVWSQYYPNSVLEMRSAKEMYAANYADDARLAKLLRLSTSIAMLIAAFGVYVLAADAVRRRTKEIALRKLFGTRRGDIGKLVARDIGTVILLAAVIALPASALAIARYLAPFSEQTPFAYWSLAIALALALATAAVAAARQTWTAMVLKPAVALRS